MRPFYLFFLLVICIDSFAQKKSKKDYLITFKTPYGEMKAILHDQTPLHKQNFIKLVEEKFYDNLLFHRVIEGFMIQGGDPNSRNAAPGERLGSGGGNLEKIPAEFRPELFHQKGALAAARDNNPEKKSSACQFYIVQGKIMDEITLDAQLKRGGRIPIPPQKEAYKTVGGTPHLDGGYTVFGQVISGMAVIDSIASRPRDRADRPLEDIKMVVSVEKMKKKKITKRYSYRFE